MKKYFYILIIFILLLSITIQKVIEVSLTTSITKLIRSLGGVSKIEPGTVFQYLEGYYPEQQYIQTLAGNSTHHIQIKGVKGTIVDSFSLYDSSYIDLIGPFEIRNTTKESAYGGTGVAVVNGLYVTVQDFYIHHTYANCIRTGGQHILIKNNIVHDCYVSEFWGGQGIRGGMGNYKDIMSNNISVINNTVYRVHGEGLTLDGDNCTARNNTVHDTISVLIYSVNSRNIIIENNFLYTSTDEFNTDEGRAKGIAIGIEDTKRNISSVNILIRNNLVVNCKNGIHRLNYGKEMTYFSGVKILHNTFINCSSLGLQFNSIENFAKVKDNEVSNNLFSGDYNYIANKAITDSFKVFANGWIKPNSKYILYDTMFYNSSFIIKDNMSNVIFGQNYKKDCFNVGCYLPKCLEDFTPQDKYQNVVIGKGIKSNFSNGYDFFRRKRNGKNPSIDFSESCVLPVDWIDNNGISG